MTTINRCIVLSTLIKHETLTIDDIGKKENLGVEPDLNKLHSLLDELCEEGFIEILVGVEPITYTITESGIKEGERLNA